ncbi:MAG: xanthine dehydrogenase accessory protein XdhC [bacterium]|jgi:xanthine dehydrogenase accessory factor
MREFLTECTTLLDSGTPFVAVTLVEAKGSTPQDSGSRMLVTPSGRHWGTVGGGRVEAKALQEASDFLQEARPLPLTRLLHWNLNKDVGMTCGGSVTLFFERHRSHPWTIVIYGAGHVAQTLIPQLLPLECRLICLDSRPEWLERLPSSPKLEIRHEEALSESVNAIPPEAFVLFMTQGHATDRPILARFLERGSQAFLGVIGSRSKAATLRKELRESGFSEAQLQSFSCPLGLSLGTNHPHEIAISISAQLLHERDRRFGKVHPRNPLPLEAPEG